MIVISFKTKKDQDEILDRAVKYFRDTVGLKVTERGSCCVYFGEKNKLGYVNVTLSQDDDTFEVQVESREYDFYAKEFAKEFK